MFYRPEQGHGLPHNPFSAIITPRPIAWISTRGGQGDNLAPYSFFNGVAYTPPQVMFATTSGKPDQDWVKDSSANILETEVFCVNIVEFSQMGAMNITSGAHPADVDEFHLAGLDKAECKSIDCPRVATAPASLECRLSQVVKLEGEANTMIIGTVTGVHLRDDCVVDGKFDVTRFQPLARLGYRDYTRVAETITLQRPDDQ